MATIKELKDMVDQLKQQIKALENENIEKVKPIRLSSLILFLILVIQTYYPLDFFNIFFLIIDNYFKLILISWPATLLILGAVLFFKFESSISYFIKHRMTGIGPDGIKAGTIQEQKEDTSIEKAKEEVILSTKIDSSDLTRVKFFERLYSFIFGSQIEILLKASRNINGITTAEATGFYFDAIDKYPEIKNYKFTDYIDFMINKAGLISLDGDISNGKILITDKGRDFLVYLATEGLSTTKSF